MLCLSGFELRSRWVPLFYLELELPSDQQNMAAQLHSPFCFPDLLIILNEYRILSND